MQRTGNSDGSVPSPPAWCTLVSEIDIRIFSEFKYHASPVTELHWFRFERQGAKNSVFVGGCAYCLAALLGLEPGGADRAVPGALRCQFSGGQAGWGDLLMDGLAAAFVISRLNKEYGAFHQLAKRFTGSA